jgi:hypothetical protein
MRLLSPARTCHMGAYRTREPQREGPARQVPPHALLDLDATSFPNTEALVRSEGSDETSHVAGQYRRNGNEADMA